MFEKINYNLFTLFNIGTLPASGTFASLFTVIFYFILTFFFSNFFFYILLFSVLIYSFFFLNKILIKFKNKDPKEIVIDEFIGQLIPLIACQQNLYLIIASFLSFRFFDITKIFPASYFDQKIKGSIGIIGDDIVAGLYSLIIIIIIKQYL